MVVLNTLPDNTSLTLCSISDGRHGQSRWCSATSLSCTFVQAPIFCVEPSKKRTCPLLTFANSSAFLISVFASWMNAISFSGTPFSISFFLYHMLLIDFKISFINSKSVQIYPLTFLCIRIISGSVNPCSVNCIPRNMIFI